MSRIGNAPVEVPQNVTVNIAPYIAVIKGPKGEQTVHIPDGITLALEGTVLTVARRRNDTKTKALHGTVAALLKNSIEGVTNGWTKKLELHGVGYRAQLSGTDIVLNVGFSHQVTIKAPQGITFATADGKITVSGIDKHLVGQTAATIRSVRPPEPYKGKGIRYAGEHVRKKAGKSAKGAGAGPGA